MDFLPGTATDLPSSSSAFNASVTPLFNLDGQDVIGGGTKLLDASTIITVNSTADVVNTGVGVTTLRDAINFANADTGEDVIEFDSSLFASPQIISLSLGELSITHSLSIIAPQDSLTGADLVTVSGNNATRVFEIGNGTTVNLSGLIVADGLVTNNDGGGIKNSGTLTLDNSIVRNDSANSGGGIANSRGAMLTVSNSTITGNSTRSSGNGGGIDNTGTLTVSNSTITGNLARSGGGISNSGTLTVSNSTLNGNSATFSIYGGTGDGGSISNTGTVLVSNSTLSGNSAANNGGGISNTGTLTVSNSTLTGNSAANSGGGINNSSFKSTLEVSNSTLSGNSAANNGGGIFNDGTIFLIGDPNNATVTINNSTLTLNQAADGGGVFNLAPGSARVRNTIIASNLKSADGLNPDVAGRFTSDGYNLIGDGTGSSGFAATGDIVGTSTDPIDPRLGPLSANGGPTQTHALLEDSPAIDAGDPTLLDTDPNTDQRGFPRVSGERADIGAFEFSNA